MQQDDNTAPSTMRGVYERIHRQWAALEETIGRLTDTELTAPGRNGEWSIKDHLAHITGWEQYLLAVLNGEPAHEVFGIDQVTYESLDTDGLNAQLHARTKDHALAEVLDASRRIHERVLGSLADLSDADLHRPMAEFWDAPADSRPLLWKIAGNTYEHYAEHRAWILAQLDV